HLRGREECLRKHRIAGRERREQPAHDGAAGIDLARLRQTERFDEASVCLGGKRECWNDGKKYDKHSYIPSFHHSEFQAASRFSFANPRTNCVMIPRSSLTVAVFNALSAASAARRARPSSRVVQSPLHAVQRAASSL